MQHRGGGDGAAGVVAGQFLVVDLAHGGNFLALGDAAGVADVDAEVVDEFAFDEFAIGPLGVELLAGAQGDIGMGAQGGEGGGVFRADGVFNEEGAVGFDGVAEFDGAGWGQAGVDFEDDFDVVV